MTAPATPPDWDAIARYLSGESSAEEAVTVREWLEKNPADRELVERLNSAAAVPAPADVDVEAALAKVHTRMAEPERPRLRVERGGVARESKPSRVKPIVWIGGVAAAAAAVFVAVRQRTEAPASSPVQITSYSTGVGERSEIKLADGSRVLLGPQSKLTVRTDSAAPRAVELTGDAYFDVVHNAARPFSVKSGSALIEDIGTTFTVESDEGDMTSVVVVTGSVRLRHGGSAPADGVVLEAGDKGSLAASGVAKVDRKAMRPEDTSWITGKLEFRDAPLSRVAAELRRWYGVTLQVDDSTLLTRRVTTSFENESADQALRILGLAIDVRITRKGDSAIVTSHRGPTTSR